MSWLFFQNFPDLVFGPSKIFRTSHATKSSSGSSSSAKRYFSSDLLTSHYQTFRKRVPIFQLIYPSTAKWSVKAATIVGQIFLNHIPTIFVDISDGRRKSLVTLDFILNKNALGAKFQSVYAMNLEEDDFFHDTMF